MKSFVIGFAERRPLTFGAAMTIVMMLAKVPFAPLVSMSGGAGTTEGVVAAGAIVFVVAFLGLPIETFFGQALPIWLLRLLRVRRWRWLILGSSLVFGAMHLIVDVGSFFVGFGGGLALSVCWLAWREQSLSRAFWGTTAVHAAHNAIAFGVYFLTVN